MKNFIRIILVVLCWGAVSPVYAEGAQPPYDPGNVFAGMLRGEVPFAKVYEDEWTLVFMNHRPRADGAMLVIPKKPSVNILDTDPQVLQHVILTVQKMARAAIAAYHADGVMIRQNNGAASEQTVFYLHFHVVPRYNHVPLREGAYRPLLTAEQQEQQAEKMRRVLVAQAGNE